MKIAFLLLLIPTLACAESRTSSNYTLIQETTTDSYGQRSSSPNYTLDDSGNGGNVSSSTNYTHRDGFAGQLLDPASISVTPFVSTVPEESSTQLTTDLTYDDGTIEADITPTYTSQSELSATVSSSGLVQTQPIVGNTSVIIQAEHLGLTSSANFIITNDDPDNFLAYGSDGLPDNWQVSNFGLPPNADAAPTENPDGDNWDNFSEYLTGFDPNDPTSALCFEITEVASEVTFELTKMIPGTRYLIFTSNDLAQNNPWATAIETTVPEEVPNVQQEKAEIEIPTPTGEKQFFRLEVEPDE